MRKRAALDGPELRCALPSDGAPTGVPYPFDVDRGFEALDEIKG